MADFADLPRVEGDQSLEVPVVYINPNTWEAKERAKWEQFPTAVCGFDPNRVGNPPHRRSEREKRWPKMLYHAERRNGKVMCMEAPPHPLEFSIPEEFERVRDDAERFTRECQLIVNNEVEEANAKNSRKLWRDSIQEAIQACLDAEKAVSTATAHRHYEDSKMSEKAQEEIRKAEAEGDLHVPVIEEKPKAKRKYVRSGKYAKSPTA